MIRTGQRYRESICDGREVYINESWLAEDRRKLLGFARDLVNSDSAGHRLTFQFFTQAPPFAHLSRSFGRAGRLDFFGRPMDPSNGVPAGRGLSAPVDSAVRRWYRDRGTEGSR